MVNIKKEKIIKKLEALNRVSLSVRQMQRLCLFACDCVVRVLPIYEQYYKDDVRPRKLLEITSRWLREEISDNEFKLAVDTEAARRANLLTQGPPEEVVYFNWAERAAQDVDSAMWEAVMATMRLKDIDHVINVVRLAAVAAGAAQWARGKSATEEWIAEEAWQVQRFREILG